MFTWDSLPRPILCLAPMAGYTDSPFRQIVKEICPQVICFTEFTSVDGILHGNEATLRQIFFNPERERPIVAQIFGKKPENFQAAAAALTQLGVNAVDINMGCPAKKIISSDCGSSLLKDPTLAEEIVRATVEGTLRQAQGDIPIPVSVKMRIGVAGYDPDYFFDFAKRMERAGAKLITIHGRTSKQMYGGAADWQPIYELKKMMNIPIVGNGDIRSGAEAVEKIGNLDGLMVGRGSFGNPWVFLEIAAAFEGKKITAPSFEEKIPWIKRHFELACQGETDKRSSGSCGFPLRSEAREGWIPPARSSGAVTGGNLRFPPERAVREMRKHMAWYIRGIPHASEVRQRLMAANGRGEVLAILEDFRARSSVVRV